MSVGQKSPALPESITQVEANFPSEAAMQEAVGRLVRAGVDRAQLSLPASGTASDPNTEDDERQARTLGASTAAAAGGMLGAAAVVATGGAALAAAAAAAGIAAVAGGGVFAATSAADPADHVGREAAAAQGALVLAVTPKDEAQAARIEAELRGAGGNGVRRVAR